MIMIRGLEICDGKGEPPGCEIVIEKRYQKEQGEYSAAPSETQGKRQLETKFQKLVN